MATTVGAKFLLAMTGSVLFLFVCVHLLGNLLIYLGADVLNAYAERIHHASFLIYPLRVVLGTCLLVHMFLAIRLYLRNRRAQGTPYTHRNYRTASISSRTMIYTGAIVLFFILYHLAHLTLRVTDERFTQLAHHDIYRMLVLSFSQPLVAGFYIMAMIFLGLHLRHGIASLLQTFGLSNKHYERKIIRGGQIIAWFIMLGNISIPLSIYLGVIK